MTNKPMLSVERDLVERAVQAIINTSQMKPALNELRALLDSPSECRCRRYGKDNPHWPCPVHAEPAAQHQAGSMSFEQARDGIADFLADNMPMKKYTLAEVEQMIREVAPTPTNRTKYDQ